MFDEDLNVLDGTQEPVVEALEPVGDIGEVVDPASPQEQEPQEQEPQEQEPQEQEPQEQEQVVQTREENAKFKEVRQSAEQKAKAEMLNQFDNAIANLGLTNPVSGKPIQSYNDLNEYQRVKPIADMANEKGITFEEEVRQRENFKREVLRNDPEYQSLIAERNRLRQEQNDKQLSEDLAEIKKAYPEEQAKHIFDLGEEFITLCANGVSAKVAYEAIRNGRPKQAPPPSMGDIKGVSTEVINKYATMSDSDFEKEIQRAERGELLKGR